MYFIFLVQMTIRDRKLQRFADQIKYARKSKNEEKIKRLTKYRESEYIAAIGGTMIPCRNVITLVDFSAMFSNAKPALLEQLRDVKNS